MIHLARHVQDRGAWPSPAVCERSTKKMTKHKELVTRDPAQVTCPACRRWIDGWTDALVRKQF